jgi:Transposase IS116/IS110/IS902 family
MAKNRLQGLLHQHNIIAPATDPFASNHHTWWEALEQQLPPSECLRAQQDLALVAYLTSLIQTVETELAHLSQQEPWKSQVPFLIQLPGIGLIAAMTVLAAVGEIMRFSSAKHLVGYAGLGTRVHASGQVHRSGSITRCGRSELRTVLVEAAWTTIRTSAWWRARYELLARGMPPAKAIVAIAHQLLVIIWHVLTARTADQQADPKALARRLFRWGAPHHLATRAGLSRSAFVRSYLDYLGVGEELTHFAIRACAERHQSGMLVSKPGYHQFAHCQIDERLATGVGAFKIAREAAMVRDPGVGALDFPSMALDLKPSPGQKPQDRLAVNEDPLVMRLITRPGKDFGLPAQKVFDPRDKRPCVAVIGKQMAQARETSDELLQEQACSVAVADVGSMHQDRQDQALRVNQEVPLATQDFFPEVCAAFSASHGTGFDRLTEGVGRTRFLLAPHLGSHLLV